MEKEVERLSIAQQRASLGKIILNMRERLILGKENPVFDLQSLQAHP